MWDYQKYMQAAHPDFIYEPAAHHDKIIEALHALERGEYRGVLICAPPGSAKSTYVSVNFATWYALRHPTHHILACSNTTDLAETFNRRRRNVCYSPEWQRLAETQISKDQQGISRFGLEAGGTMTAAGVGSSIVGLRAHLLILDDPIMSFEQAMSMTQLDKIWDWLETDARSRLLPTGKTVIVTTRWSKKDPAGRIMSLIAAGEEKDWLVLRLPMLCDDPANDPLGREMDAPLWPAWYGQHQLEQNQRDPLRWSALYQQRPLDETGSWVPADKLRVSNSVPGELTYVVGVDLALSVGQGDWTVMAVCGLDSDRVLHVVDVRRARVPPNESADMVFSLCLEYSPTAVLIDDDNSSKVWTRLVFELARERNQSIPLYPLPIRGKDKETRAAAIRGYFLADRVMLSPGRWNSAVMHELLDFPNGDHDDIVDALSLVGRHLVSTGAPTAPRAVNKDPYAGFLIRPDMPDVYQCSLDDLWGKKQPRSFNRI